MQYMFDHLTPSKNIKIKKFKDNDNNLIVYSFLLSWAIFLTIFFNLEENTPLAIAIVDKPKVDIILSKIENNNH